VGECPGSGAAAAPGANKTVSNASIIAVNPNAPDVRLPPIADIPSPLGPACHGGGAKLSPLAVAPGSDPADTAPERALFQPKTVPASRFVERLRSGAGRRALGLGLTLAIEALLLFLLLRLVTDRRPGAEERRLTVVSLPAEISEDTPEAPRPEPEQRARRQAERPQPPEPAPPQPQPAAAPPPPPVPVPSPPAPPAAPQSVNRPPATARPVYGPPDTRPAYLRDTERVGTAPNGEPLYAAEWYREPEEAMMRAYLSTSRGPGWGLIACRTAPDYRVEDCVALAEYPEGSQINRSVLAAAWEFRVRPPRRGGRLMVGSWVRIRIDYGLGRH